MKIIEIKNPELLEEEIIIKGYNQRTLSNKIMYSQSMLSSILSGKRRPSFILANSICKAINCKFNKFFLIKNIYKSK